MTAEKWLNVYTADDLTTVICLICKEMDHIRYPCNMEEWNRFMESFDRNHRVCRDKRRKEAGQ